MYRLFIIWYLDLNMIRKEPIDDINNIPRVSYYLPKYYLFIYLDRLLNRKEKFKWNQDNLS